MNVILLGVVAALYGVVIGIISVAYTVESVLIASGITCITVFIVTAFAFWTNIDFTKCIGFITVLGQIFFIICLISIQPFSTAYFRNSSHCVWHCLCNSCLEWLGRI